MNRNTTNYSINHINSSGAQNKLNAISDKNVSYKLNNSYHENYWFQDLSNTIFNLNYALKIFPDTTMTYPEKINTLVRLSLYIGLILGLFYSNYLYLYIPIITMTMTYLLYIFRLDQLENSRAQQGPNAKLNSLTSDQLNLLINKIGSGEINNKQLGKMTKEDLKDMLNIRTCSKPNTNNPFMNALAYDSRTRDPACDAISPDNQLQIEEEYNKYCIKDISDIFNHNSGRRQFYTMPSTTYPNNQGGFANWLYKTPPTCKEGNGAQCVANYYTPLNKSLLTPGYGSKA